MCICTGILEVSAAIAIGAIIVKKKKNDKNSEK